MSIQFEAPKTVAAIAAVYAQLAPSRDASQPARLQFWIDRYGDKALAELSPDDVDAALAELESNAGPRGKMLSGPTINRYRMAAQSLIKFARRKRLLPRGWHSPFADIPQHEEHTGKLRYLSVTEEERLMAAARLQAWVLLPLLIRLAIVTGLRCGALLALKWGDICLDADDPHVTVERTKNGDPHVSPLTADLVAEFKRVKRPGTQHNDMVFCGKRHNVPHNFRHCYKKAVQDAGLGSDVTFHTLRHTSCSRLAQAGCDILEIATHAGHKSLSMTRRYAHLSIKGRAATVTSVFA